MLEWDKNDERYYHHGLDRGVLYPAEVPDPVEVGRNMMPNPDVIDTSSYVGVNASIAAVNNELVVTATNDTSNSSFVPIGGDTGGMRLGMVAGKTYTVSATVTTPSAIAAGGNGLSRALVIYYKSPSIAGGAYQAVASASGPSPGTARVSKKFTLPADTTEVFIRAFNGALGGSQVVKWSKFLLEESADLHDYYSGSSVEDQYRYSWSGTPNASASIKKQIIGTAIPWNGLTGMDESGNGSSAIYYIDGQVYLADVEPTDFAGKLSAYSWPKEFSKCLGIPETGGGLYVDNQKPKRCGLSYRTLVGSGLGNDRFGYQINLIYNAMPAIGARTRKSVANTPAPMEFSFDLTCTPVGIPGYRPSAHYIIDTRGMNQATLDKLEGILYGDATHAPRMPTPAELQDTLNFGSAITFTKYTHPILGECWTASGSSANVHYVGDGSTFEILNVNGSDLGNGQYMLSDTA